MNLVFDFYGITRYGTTGGCDITTMIHIALTLWTHVWSLAHQWVSPDSYGRGPTMAQVEALF